MNTTLTCLLACLATVLQPFLLDDEADCYSLTTCLVLPTNPPMPVDNGKSDFGEKLSGLQSSALDQAIEKIEDWEANCGLGFPSGDPQVPSTPPSEKLRSLQDAKAICAQGHSGKNKEALGSTSPTSEQISEQEWVPAKENSDTLKKTKMEGGPGMNINPSEFPEQLKGEGGEPLTHEVTLDNGETIDVPSFDPGEIVSLASTLIHESYHANNPATDADGKPLTDWKDWDGFEKGAYEATIAALCGVVNCPDDAEGVSSADKDALCAEIRNENRNLCKNGASPIGCETCDGHGGDGSDEKPCPPVEVVDDPEVLPPIKRHQDLILPVQSRASLDVVDSELYVLLKSRGEVLEATFDLSAEIEAFQPLSMATISRGSFLIAGYDRDTEEAVFVQVLYEVSAPSFIDFVEVYRGIDTCRPVSIQRIPGTRSYVFIDFGRGRLLEVDLRNGMTAIVHDYSAAPDQILYTSFMRTEERRGDRRAVYYCVTAKESILNVTHNYSSYLIDRDGDGHFEINTF